MHQQKKGDLMRSGTHESAGALRLTTKGDLIV